MKYIVDAPLFIISTLMLTTHDPHIWFPSREIFNWISAALVAEKKQNYVHSQ